jgi:hypothetical protein
MAGRHLAALIAGISLVDGAAMLFGGTPLLATTGVAAFLATLRLQRRVSET